MAVQSMGGFVPLPVYPYGAVGGLATATNVYVLDAADEKAALIVRASESKSIRKIHFRTGTVTTGATMDVRIESVDTSGNPSGTLLATDTNVAHAVASGDDNVWLVTAALTADAAVAPGDLYAIVIVNPSGGNWAVESFADEISTGSFPYGNFYTASWAKRDTRPVFFVEYSDGSFASLVGMTGAGAPVTTTTFSSSSTPDEIGMILQVPFPCVAQGCWVYIDCDGDFTAILYDSDGTTELASLAVTSATNVRQSNASGLHFLPFTTAATLAKDTNYRLVVRPDSTTSVVIYTFTVPTAAAMDAFTGGQSIHSTSRTNAGAWTETTTTRPYMGLLLSAFDDAASGAGGGMRYPQGLSGGLV